MFQIPVDLFDDLESLHLCSLDHNSNKQKENSHFHCHHINKWLKFLQMKCAGQVQKILNYTSFQQSQFGSFLELSHKFKHER